MCQWPFRKKDGYRYLFHHTARGVISLDISSPEIINIPQPVNIFDRAKHVPSIHVEFHGTEVVLLIG